MSEHTIATAENSLPPFEPGRAFGQLWQVPTFLLGVLALLFVAANSRLLRESASAQFRAELAQLRQTLDAKEGKLNPWLEKCPRLLAEAERYRALSGEAYFLMGSLHWRLSEEGPSDQAQSQRSRAEEYFEKALAQGVADGDQGQLKFRLGMVLHRQGQEVTRAVELMKEGLNLGADAVRGSEFLLQAILKQNNPNLDEALKICKQWLERCTDNEEALTRARLTHGELLMRCQRWQDALHTLERVGRSAAKEAQVKSLYLRARCCEAEGHMWRQAQKIWEDLLKEPDLVPGGKGRILYSLGLCMLNNDVSDLPSALNYWNQVAALGGEEAQAALLRIGEAQLTAGNIEPALRSWSEALSPVQKPADFHNAYVPQEQARDMIETAWPMAMDKNYESAIKLADLYERLAQPPKADLYRAQAWAARAQKTAGPDAAQFFEKSARAYERAASSSPVSEQAELFWRSAGCFQQARQPVQAVRVLERFVKLDNDKSRLAQGWLALAEAHLGAKNNDKARQAFIHCIDIPGTPSADRARYRLAQQEKSLVNYDTRGLDEAAIIAQQDKNMSQLIKAVDWLKQISPRSPNQAAYEDALFLHGALLVQMEKYDWAEVKLDEAIKRHPRHPSSWQARADLADCCLKEAEQLANKEKESSTDGLREKYRHMRLEKLELAQTTYESLADDLKQKAPFEPLSPEHFELLRLALFGRADVLVDLGRIEEAVLRYQKLQGDYRGEDRPEVECLFACERLWRCILRVPQGTKTAQELQQAMRKSLEIAEADLRQMDANLDCFKGRDIWNKERWQQWINETREQLARIAGK
jgi:tetratricopeptide (TPR) repeat protein